MVPAHISNTPHRTSQRCPGAVQGGGPCPVGALGCQLSGPWEQEWEAEPPVPQCWGVWGQPQRTPKAHTSLGDRNHAGEATVKTAVPAETGALKGGQHLTRAEPHKGHS